MSDEKKTDEPDDTKAQIDAREAGRAVRRATLNAARDAQYLRDLDHIEELEIAHGADRVAVLRTPSYMADLPTSVVVKTPSPEAFKRYRQLVRRNGTNLVAMGDARDQLTAACVVFPDGETYAKMKDAWPSIHDSAAQEAVRLGEAEGKG